MDDLSVKQNVYNKIIRAKRPSDLFGKDIKTGEDLKKAYRALAKVIHPDTAIGENARYAYICGIGFRRLEELLKQAEDELSKGLYGIVNIVDIYKTKSPLFTVKLHNKAYDIYEQIQQAEVSDVYRGLCDGQLIVIKLALDEADNDLFNQEYETLSKYSHLSLPIVIGKMKINNRVAIVMDYSDGTRLVHYMKRHNRIEPYIVAWIMERLLSVVGYLHSNYIVHGNIIPENIVLNGSIHNVILTGFTFHIFEANREDKHYNIKNGKYSPPDLDKSSKVLPSSDIYSLGKLFIYMLGGDIDSNGMPVDVDIRMREFIRKKLVEKDIHKRSDDAWKLWSEWQILRQEIFGKPKFQVVNFED